MKFSSRTASGLRAMLYLADHYGQRSVSTAQIARQAGISRPFLEQILFILKRKHWIKGVRGPSGGYVLAKRPADIALGPLLRDLEGKIFSISVQKEAPHGASSLAAILFWEGLFSQLKHHLESVTLQKLLDQASKFRKGKQSFPRLDFNI